MLPRQLLLLVLPIGGYLNTTAKSTIAADTIPNKITLQYINAVSDKADKLGNKMDEQTEQYLLRLQKQEAKLEKKLCKIDSLTFQPNLCKFISHVTISVKTIV